MSASSTGRWALASRCRPEARRTGAEGAQAAGFAQGAGSPVSLNAAVAGGVRGRGVRIGEDDLVAGRFEASGSLRAFG